MTFTSKLFFIALALAFFPKTASAAKGKPLTELSDISISSTDIAEELTAALNQILVNLAQPKTSLADLLPLLSVYKERIDSLDRKVVSEKDVIKTLKMLFDEEAKLFHIIQKASIGIRFSFNGNI